MTILTLLQARLSSSRLPGKVLLPILGEPMLVHQIRRIKESKLYGKVMVVTSTHEEDNAIVECCKKNNIPYFCGDLHNVLDRFYQATTLYKADHIIRLTGDNPLVDPKVIDKLVAVHLEQKVDYTSNVLHPTYPDGLDVEVIRFSALETAWNEAVLPSDREHVTPFIYRNAERFRVYSVINEKDLSHLRWTVDWQDDFILITKIYEALYPHNKRFTMQDILQLLVLHPELKTWNINHERNEGLKKSLREDENYDAEILS